MGQRDERKKGQKGWAWLSQCKESAGLLLGLLICRGMSVRPKKLGFCVMVTIGWWLMSVED